jgi:pimeloyl-ACP methyl ester carboxylesterase
VRVEIEDGVGIYFDVAGEGLVHSPSGMRQQPTVLMLHGGPGADHTTLKPSFSQLADIAQVIYIDQRSQGRSDRRPADEWNLDTWADDVRRFSDALGVESPIVIGTSFGGMVAQRYASRHPDHPAGIVLISTTAMFDVEASIAAFGKFGGEQAAVAARNAFTNPSEETRNKYFEICGPLYTKRPGNVFESVIWFHELTEHFIHGEQRSMDLRPGLANVKAPCQVLAGSDDPIFPAESSRVIAAALTGTSVDLRVFEDCAHGVQRDQPAQTFTAVREFISSIERP